MWNPTNLSAERDRLDWLENQQGRTATDGGVGTDAHCGDGEQPGLFTQVLGATMWLIFSVSMFELLKSLGVL